MNQRWVVGVDGGGTKTAALCLPMGAGGILRRAQSGPCNIAAMDPADAATNVKSCTDSLGISPGDVSSLCAGVAGYSAADHRVTFIRLLSICYPNASLDVVPDYIIAHSGAFPDGVGVIVIAGTGSIAYGVNPIGESAVVGGYGYLVDDSGTGYGLGRQVIAAAGKTFDGCTDNDYLTNLFQQKTGLDTREKLIASVYGGALDRLAIAGLAPLVAEAAEAGDSFSASLLMHAGGALARTAQSAIVRLFSDSETVPLAKIGSLWNVGGELDAVFDRSIHRACRGVRMVPPAQSPVEGALQRAHKHDSNTV